ncbi:hypothetical protein [Sneathiella limimaris]|uniref:hypothetical protein n=1 Tax=Sneathiella limimaris TaxID=1964213 RepID=UPI00146F2769|nr:hypothetical protein [Sneathiella limimaris]
MSLLQELSNSIIGCYRIAKRDPDALSWFNISAGGFWTSFAALVLSIPVYLIHSYIIFSVSPDIIQQTNMNVELTAREFSIWPSFKPIIAWLAYLAVVLIVSKSADFANRYGTFVIVYNWSQFLINLLSLLLFILLYGLVGASLLTVAYFAFLCLAYFFLFMVISRTLAVNTGIAIGLVVLEFILSTVISLSL